MTDKPKRRRRRATGRPKLHPVPDLPADAHKYGDTVLAASLWGVEWERAARTWHLPSAGLTRPKPYKFVSILTPHEYPRPVGPTLAAWLSQTYGKRPPHFVYYVALRNGHRFLIQGNRGIGLATNGQIVTSRKLPYRRSHITHLFKIMSAAHHDLIQRVKN